MVRYLRGGNSSIRSMPANLRLTTRRELPPSQNAVRTEVLAVIASLWKRKYTTPWIARSRSSQEIVRRTIISVWRN